MVLLASSGFLHESEVHEYQINGSDDFGLFYISGGSDGKNTLTIFRTTCFFVLQQTSFYLSHNVAGYQENEQKWLDLK